MWFLYGFLLVYFFGLGFAELLKSVGSFVTSLGDSSDIILYKLFLHHSFLSYFGDLKCMCVRSF